MSSPRIPTDATAYKRTREMTHEDIPRGLLRQHETLPGVWGRVVVTEGLVHLRFLDGSGARQLLTTDEPGIIAPEIPHRLELMGPVRLYVEFFHVPPDP